MIDALSPQGKRELSLFLTRRPLLAFDFDGTLAPIVDEPRDAALPSSTRAHLERLAGLAPVAILSGRARADVAERVAGLGIAWILGDHGLDDGAATERPPPIDTWLDRLSLRLANLEGVVLEAKPRSLSVHYRRSGDPARAAREIGRALGDLPDARVVRGRCVFNLLPATAGGKPVALETLCRTEERGAAMFVGDDDTDEEVFSGCRSISVLGVRVEPTAPTAAHLCLRRQADIDDLLRHLVEVVGREGS